MAATLPAAGPMPASAAIRRSGSRVIAELAGDWQINHATPRFEPLLEASLSEGGEGARSLSFDASDLGQWDSSLIIFLLHAQDQCAARDLQFDATGLPPRMTRLLELARAVPEHGVRVAEPKASRVARLGETALSAWDGWLAAVTFTGAVLESLLRLLSRRTRMQWRSFWVIVQSNSSGAVPIVGLIALLVGVIIAFLGVVVLRRFGAGYYVSYLVGYGMLREMGALMTGIIMAGRTGAAFAAELGSMKITEEIDAYTTLGVSPIDHLVLPRMLGLFVMMPLLVIYADFVGIIGGMLVAVTLLDLTPTQFFGGLLSAVNLSDALLGIFKATVFGLIIGLAGCMKGLQTGSDASAVGRSVTSAVVTGITLIILANAVIDWLAALLQV
jgi:phospholipid/cholesterol/gamma-HCH transport system permease protein